MSELNDDKKELNKKRKSDCLGNEGKLNREEATFTSENPTELFTIYPDPETGLIDKNQFLSTFSTYKVIYLPQILGASTNQSIPTFGHAKVGSDENSITKDRVTDDQNQNGSSKEHFTWRDVYKTFSALNEKDKASWTEEKFTKTKTKKNSKNRSKDEEELLPPTKLEPGAFLCPKDEIAKDSTHISVERGYSSFIVQHDKETMCQLLQSLPLTQLPVNKDGNINSKTEDSAKGDVSIIPKQSNNENMKMKHGPCIWLFYGRNNQQEPLDGRPEHTDSISHDGTWHYQLSGIKEWHLKPTEDLIKQMQSDVSFEQEEMEFWKNENSHDRNNNIHRTSFTESNEVQKSASQRRRVKISCQEGDVLLVNTRLWWHSTNIPQQPIDEKMKCKHVPSVSYARDLYLTYDENEGDECDDDIVEDDGDMTNLDGLYASNDIEAGTIIFTEADMPDCELHRARNNPNCEVIQLEDGSGAIVSCRNITAGEFFCVLESDDEDSDEDGSGDNFEELESEICLKC